MSDNYKTIHLCVRGKVQGVAYRAWMVRLANKLQVKGWVRNQHDGSVEALLQGPSKSVNELLEACRSGPPAAATFAATCTTVIRSIILTAIAAGPGSLRRG